MRLAIVGSTSLTGSEAARRAVRDQIVHWQNTVNDQHEEFVVVSGGAAGVDTMAEEEAEALGIPTVIFRPRVRRWAGPGGYRERNLQVAAYCTHLVRIADATSQTYGSGWTRDQAEELGKVILPEVVI